MSTRQVVVVIWFCIMIVEAVHLYLVLVGDRLARETALYERETERLQIENIDLERDVSRFTSLQYAREFGARYGFREPDENQIIKLQ